MHYGSVAVYSQVVTKLMESELNKTPVKNEYEYDSESPVGAFSDLFEKSESPCYVKWDFVVPAFSEKIKNAAMKLKSDVRKERLKQLRNLRRCQDRRHTPTKPKNESSFNKTFTSAKQLEKTMNELLSYNEKTASISKSSEASSSQMFIDKCDNSIIESSKDKIDIPSDDNDDMFNDSVNDLFAECSQSIEDTFYSKRKKSFDKEKSKNVGIYEAHTSGSLDQFISEKDDDLFLKVDLNNLDKSV